jgi:hypothetical protein
MIGTILTVTAVCFCAAGLYVQRQYTAQLAQALLDFEGTVRFVSDRQFRKFRLQISRFIDFKGKCKRVQSLVNPQMPNLELLRSIENDNELSQSVTAQAMSEQQMAVVRHTMGFGDNGGYRISNALRSAMERHFLAKLPKRSALSLICESCSDWLHDLCAGKLSNPLNLTVGLCAKYSAAQMFAAVR